METSELIETFFDFIDSNLKAELLEVARKDDFSLQVDFNKLVKFSPGFTDLLLERPEDVIKAAEMSIERFDISKKINVRFQNLPKSAKILIRDIRSKHINKLLTIVGVVRQKTDVRPQVVETKFECPSCGNIIPILQLGLQKLMTPSKCSCGRKGKFNLKSKELIDVQKLVLEEAAEDLEGGEQPKRFNVIMKKDLVSPFNEKKTNPGTKVEAVGVVKEVPILLKSGGQSTRFELMFECNNIMRVDEDFGDLTINKQDVVEIKELAKDPNIFEKLKNSIAPSIYGHDRVKDALILQLFGGVRKIRDDGVITRGDTHILLIGDPGAAKSQMLRRLSVVAPKARYVSGKGVTGAGLTASVVRDEFTGGWSLEAGAIVLANKGYLMIDEMDKMNKEDRDAMHEAMEQQSVSISKANIQATLRAETSVLAAANPKFGRFDPYMTIAEQIDLPPSLINRFDLIFPIKDLPDKTKDTAMSKFILKLHQNKAEDKLVVDIDTGLLRKYVAYARQNVFPVLTDTAITEIQSYYLKMRGSGTDTGGVKSVPISARQLEALVRMSEASARVRLADKVTVEDAKRAVELIQYCLSEIAIDRETGKIDIDKISSGITASERGKIFGVKEIINDLENKIGKFIPIDDIIKEAEAKGINIEKVEETIEKLKRSGDIFEPKRGFISKL
ncbi:minichromosome maintenance protein MCM [Candidatus Woesearchaeota archaeon]|nr:minichromosome maintenance protein MCM [Candidatus Woesearchaeota archaeon]MBW3017333.1 minichromosome maintenance protein MCM [Candidatus Woesearchaeota archaeon]